MENFIKIENFLNICRFCLQESMQMTHLIDNNRNCDNKTIKSEGEAEPDAEGESNIIKIINLCTGLQILPNDVFPKSICSECFQQFMAFYNFRTKCILSIEILNNEFKYKTLNHNIDEKPSNVYEIKRERYTDSVDTKTAKRSNEIKKSKSKLNKKDKFKNSEKRDNNKKANDNVKADYRKVCYVCGCLSFNLKRHMITHTGIKPYECDICGQLCSDRGNIIKHLYIHTNTRHYKCKICSRTFVHPTSLRVHKTTHTDERKYSCQYCDRSFRLLSSRNYHHLTHTQLRKFKCDQCQKLFLRSTHLQRHYQIHTGIRPFKCENCSSSFGQLATLKTHQRVHLKEYLNKVI